MCNVECLTFALEKKILIDPSTVQFWANEDGKLAFARPPVEQCFCDFEAPSRTERERRELIRTQYREALREFPIPSTKKSKKRAKSPGRDR